MQRKTLVLVLILGALGGLAPAVAAPAGAAAPSAAAFATELEAVVAASGAVNARSIREDREFLGAVLRRGNDFHYSVAPGTRRRGPDPGPAGRAGRLRAGRALAHPRRGGPRAPVFLHRRCGPGGQHREAAVPGGLHGGAPGTAAGGSPAIGRAARRLGLPGRPGYARGEQLSPQDGERVHIPTRTEPALAVAVSN